MNNSPRWSATKRTLDALTIAAVFISLNALSQSGAKITDTLWIVFGPVVQGNALAYAQVMGPIPVFAEILSLASSFSLIVFVWLIREDYRRRLSGNLPTMIV